MDICEGMLLKSATSCELFRVLWKRMKMPIVYLLDVSGKIPASRMPIALSTEEVIKRLAEGTLRTVEESVRLPEMTLSDEKLPFADKQKREVRFSLISSLIEPEESLIRVLAKESRGFFIKDIAEKTDIPVSRLYRLLTTYWWFGGDKNALLPRRSTQGFRILKKSLGVEKLGRPNACAILNKSKVYYGVNVKPSDLKKFEKALQKYYVKQNLTLASTYRNMCDKYYVKWTTKEGKKTRHPIDPTLIPTLSQFRYHAKEIINTLGLIELKAGEHEWSQYLRSRTGSASDITLGPTDVYDMDGAQLKVVAVTKGKRPEVIGLMSVLLCIDRASCAITGFHEFFGGEKWQHYHFALFWALTPTYEHLRLIGLKNWAEIAEKPASFGVSGWCNGVYVDRGPARGEMAFWAVVDGLKLQRAIAPARRGDLKGVVESTIGIFQRKVAELPGGYTRQKGLRNEEHAQNAKDYAQLNTDQIREFLIAAIAEHNEFHPVPQCLTAEMIRDSVKPVPKDIFRWGQKNVRGLRSHGLTQSEIYMRLLPHHQATVTSGGIQHHKCRFTSDELEDFRHRNIGKDKLKITIVWDGVDPTRRYWKRPDGSLGILEMFDKEIKKYGGMSFSEFEDYQVRERAALQLNDIEKRRTGYISRAKEKILQEITEAKQPAHPVQAPLMTPSQNQKFEAIRQAEFLRGLSRKILAPLTEESETSEVEGELTTGSDTPTLPDNTSERKPSRARENFERHFKRQGEQKDEETNHD